MLLALDTSTALASVALYDGTLRAEATWYAGRNHSQQVMPMAVRLLQDQGLGPGDLTAVGVAIGPGSYTGVRVGLALAKGLAAARRLPLVGVTTLDVLAAPFVAAGRPVRPALDAGRRRYATALYERQGDGLVQAEPIQAVDLDGLLALLQPPVILTGDLDAAARTRLATDWPGAADYTVGGAPGVEVASPAAALRRAGFLAELAWRRLAAEGGSDPATVDAIYLG
ncbi:MAG TPA: tRNA (adenosine(37)-N6)-threonylcarbamoyltransferase complex dimerization subunit type 1 TsaB [Chloroflexota bacterium]|nr:tRNA (adenosine(37)-N6)-threonylcarbamoyltransferase complex dimerization subunit type 1 TsaB [Chloroflexota bacterium]